MAPVLLRSKKACTYSSFNSDLYDVVHCYKRPSLFFFFRVIGVLGNRAFLLARLAMFSQLMIVSALVGLVSAVTLVSPAALKRQSITTISQDQISSFKTYTFYAAAARCVPEVTRTWTCGVNCQGNPDFQPLDAGGDGAGTQFWFVGYDPHLDSAIVAHQSTNTSQILADLTDINLVFGKLNQTLFPGAPSSISVHDGFAREHEKTADQVLSSVKTVLSNSKTSTVTVVGHSLGAALSLLDSVYLRLQLPASVNVKAVVYGLPRVGNQDWANFVDAQLPGQVTHIHNLKDPVGIVPGRFLGYHHPNGEIHIQSSGDWDRCPGQDNPSELCITGAVSSIFAGNETQHDGPYDGVTIKCLGE
ncbi:lipase [Multifurca ochricompacta]|uniref:Lipase n=1 Tax=Multifurca ochricompacta TaxID=376703 RepID=A0AAD4M0F7_9AGAM|nr:lipase [Multifurca ochricompacta]